MGQIDVVYATKTGHSQKLAEAIGRVLQVKAEVVLVTSSTSTSKRSQSDIRRILKEKGVEVPEEITCPGSLLFIKLGHPNTADVKKVAERAKQIGAQI